MTRQHPGDVTNAALMAKLDAVEGLVRELLGRVPAPPVQLHFCGRIGCPGYAPTESCAACVFTSVMRNGE